MKSKMMSCVLAAGAGLVLAGSLQAADLIPRETLFGNPDRAAVRVSPDGKWLSWSAPVEGVLNLWIAPADDLDAARPVTDDRGRGITTYFWAYTSNHILYLQDEGGNENFNLYVVDLDAGETRPLAVDNDVRVQPAGTSDKFPETVLIGLNDRVAMFHDIYKLDITTGEKELLIQHPGTINGRMVAGITADEDYRVRFAVAFDDDGGLLVFKPREPKPTDTEWTEYDKVAFEDTLSSGILAFSEDPDVVYSLSSEGRDTAALYRENLNTREKELIAEDERADAGGIMMHPTERVVQAVSFNYDKVRWDVVDDRIAADMEMLEDLADGGEWGVTSRSRDDRRWLVYTSRSDGPVRYYLYERDPESPGDGEVNFLFTNNSRLERLADAGALVEMRPVVIEARDGLELMSYLTLPAGDLAREGGENAVAVPARPLPMVLLVHGGPWARDDYGYNPIHQWLANRGYAVLSVNFRGSTGFGKEHLNAGNKQWGRAMQDDLTDAVKWAVEKGIADEDKVAIMGGSYGGYATLAGLTFTPDLYAAGVDIVGPSSILTLLETVPPYWAPAIKLFHSRVGNPNDPEERQMLEDASPLNFVDRISAPLLIGQGANDPRVKQSESDQIVAAMQESGIPVTYVLYPDEGHGFARPENRLSFFGVTEGFLAEHLGGRYQPLGPDDFHNSSIQVPEGAGQVPGLEQAIRDFGGN